MSPAVSRENISKAAAGIRKPSSSSKLSEISNEVSSSAFTFTSQIDYHVVSFRRVKHH